VIVNVKVGKPEDSKVPAPPPPAAYPVNFEVPAIDADGKPLPANADLSVTTEGPENVQVATKRSGDKILISFNTTRSQGTFSVGIKSQGRHIQRSPFDLTLTGKTTNAKEEYVVHQLPPLSKHKPIKFVVPAVMSDGSRVRASELNARILKGPEMNAKTTLTDEGANDLAVVFEVATPGDYEIGVFKGSAHIAGSGFEVPVPPAAFQ